MRKIIYLLCFTLMFQTGWTQNEKVKKVTTKIKSAIIYLDGAEIHRAKKITLEKGRTKVVFTGLSPKFNPTNIQVTTTNDIELLAISHRIDYLTNVNEKPKVLKLKDSLELIQQKNIAFNNDKDAYLNEKDMMLQNKRIGGSDKGVSIAELKLAADFFRSRIMEINKAGGLAVGLSGKDGNLIEVQKLTRTKRDPDSNIERILDLGFVGEPSQINPELLQSFEEIDVIPVIAPIGVGPKGQTFNINADTAAGHIAAAIGASKLIMMTDVEGVLDKQKKLINKLTPKEVRVLQSDGTIVGGMIPKLETCLYALENGVEAAHILDGRIPHVLLLETFTEHGIGTMIHQEYND